MRHLSKWGWGRRSRETRNRKWQPTKKREKDEKALAVASLLHSKHTCTLTQRQTPKKGARGGAERGKMKKKKWGRRRRRRRHQLTEKRDKDVKALAAVSLLPSSTYTVKVPTDTKVGMAFSRKLLKVCTRNDFHSVSSSVFLTF